MDEGTESSVIETGEIRTSKIEVVDSRGEMTDVIQEKEFKERLESDKVEEKLIQFETFLGDYTKQKVSEGLKINLVYGPIGSGEVVNGILTVNLPNSSEIAETTNDPDAKQFLKVLTDAGTTYEEIAMISASSTTLHESEHMLIDSRHGSQLALDFGGPPPPNEKFHLDEGGHTLSLLDEGITYAFQLEKDSENELIQKLEGAKPQKDENITIMMRKQLGENLRQKVKEYIKDGIPLNEDFLEFARGEMKKMDIEKYVEEAEREKLERKVKAEAS